MMNDDVKAWLNEQFAGDEGTIRLVWGEYLASFAEKLAEANAAQAAEDFPLLDRVAHALKGNALMVGDAPCVAAALALRDAAKASDGVRAAAALARLAALEEVARA